MRGFLGHGPEAVVGIEVAVGVAEFDQSPCQHLEMTGFVVGAARPVAVVRVRLAAITVHRIPRQVDRVEFDMRHRVDQGGTSFGAAQSALGHLPRIDQPRPFGTARRADGCGRG